MREIIRRQNLAVICRHVSPVSLLAISASNYDKSLVDESEIIIKADGKAQYIINDRGARVALCAHPIEVTK
jgi:uncharacterized protein YccT (UPF0319 family)